MFLLQHGDVSLLVFFVLFCLQHDDISLLWYHRDTVQCCTEKIKTCFVLLDMVSLIFFS